MCLDYIYIYIVASRSLYRSRSTQLLKMSDFPKTEPTKLQIERAKTEIRDPKLHLLAPDTKEGRKLMLQTNAISEVSPTPPPPHIPTHTPSPILFISSMYT